MAILLVFCELLVYYSQRSLLLVLITHLPLDGRGYASAAVAALTQAELNDGREFVVLNVTDGNPAARIYQRLGYRLIGSRDCFLIDT